jgi:hypothetical protein
LNPKPSNGDSITGPRKERSGMIDIKVVIFILLFFLFSLCFGGKDVEDFDT